MIAKAPAGGSSSRGTGVAPGDSEEAGGRAGGVAARDREAPPRACQDQELPTFGKAETIFRGPDNMMPPCLSLPVPTRTNFRAVPGLGACWVGGCCAIARSMPCTPWRKMPNPCILGKVIACDGGSRAVVGGQIRGNLAGPGIPQERRRPLLPGAFSMSRTLKWQLSGNQVSGISSARIFTEPGNSDWKRCGDEQFPVIRASDC